MRKAKLTQELLERMVTLKRDGLTDKDICAAVGIDQSTLYRWLRECDTRLKRALNAQLKKADSEYKEELLNCIRDAARAKNSFWTAAAWLLERKYPDEYSQGRIDKKDSEVAPQIILGVTVKKADDEE